MSGSIPNRQTLASIAEAGAAGALQAYRRTFAFDDPDVAVASDEAVINFGAPLPLGAAVLGALAEVGPAFSDGLGGSFVLGLFPGLVGDPIFSAVLTLAVPQSQPSYVNGSGVQLVVRINGDGTNLDTLIAGSFVLTVLFAVPLVAEV